MSVRVSRTREKFLGGVVGWVVVTASGCSATVSGVSWSVKPTPVERVAVGDTLDEVVRKLGQPLQVVSRDVTGDGRLREVWRYEALTQTSRSVEGTVEPLSKTVVSVEKSKNQESLNRGAYLVIFVDGKVTDMTPP